MAASHLPGEPETVPEGGIDDAFLDALAGLDSVCRYLAIALGEARPGGPDPGDAPSEPPGEAHGESPEDMPEDMIDALLGLVSVHRTVSLLLAAVGTEVGDGIDEGEPGAGAPPAWSREVLR